MVRENQEDESDAIVPSDSRMGFDEDVEVPRNKTIFNKAWIWIVKIYILQINLLFIKFKILIYFYQTIIIINSN